MKLRLFLFGGFRLESDGLELFLATRKIQALLAYLVLQPQAHTREKLAARFWGDVTDEQARNSLRNALPHVRRVLGANALLVDRATVQLNPDTELWVDVREFERASFSGAASEKPALSEPKELQSRIALYRGDLLADWYDDWVLEERERLQRVYLNLLLQLTQAYRARGEYAKAIETAQRLVQHEPTEEQAYQHLMFCYHALGERAAALAAYEKCVKMLHHELGVEPQPATTALYESIQQSASAKASPAVQLTNLPVPLTSFIGRSHEIQRIQQLLEQNRLITLVGVGGCGKTRLAIEIARELVEQFRDGVWWIDLAPLTEAALVPVAVAKVLGIRDQQANTLTETVLEFVRARELLIVFDNCEHLSAACATLIEQLLRGAQQLKILATSRQVLGVEGGVVWHVPSLSLPDSTEKAIPNSEAVQLFVERAARIRPEFSLTEENAATIAHICRRLDGIPLALELADARLNALNAQDIAKRLDDRFQLLTTGGRSALPRQQTLRATLDWSFALLDSSEQILFRRLAVFASGFTLGAVEHVAADRELPETEILDLLGRLIDKSLIQFETQSVQTRYRMLETIREYAREKWTEREQNEIQARFVAYWLEVAESADRELNTAAQAETLRLLEIEYDNLRAALELALMRGNAELVLRLGVALWNFWDLRGYWHEGLGWLDAALHLAGDVPPSLTARAIRFSAITARALGNYPKAITLLEHALQLYQQSGDQNGQARTLSTLGNIARNLGQLRRARELQEQSLGLARQAGDIQTLAMTLNNLAYAVWLSGDYKRAIPLCEEAFALFQTVGDQDLIATALDNLGELMMLVNALPRAQSYLEQALELRQQIGSKLGLARSYNSLGTWHGLQNNLERAGEYHSNALAFYRELGDQDGIAQSEYNLARILVRRGDAAQAADLYRTSLMLRRQLQQPREMAESLEGMAVLAARRKEWRRALILLTAAERARTVIGAPVQPYARQELEQVWQAAGAALKEVEVATARAAGTNMDLAEAVEYALNAQR